MRYFVEMFYGLWSNKLEDFMEQLERDRLQREVSQDFVQGNSLGVGVPGHYVCFVCVCVLCVYLASIRGILELWRSPVFSW